MARKSESKKTQTKAQSTTSSLRNLKRQFGKRMVETLLKSPTLLEDIEQIREAGVRIRLVDGPCRAYYDRKKRTIYIGRWCPRNYKLISIAHEFVHALVKPTLDPIPGKTGRKEFVNRCLEEETEAIVHEIEIVKELIKAGTPVDPKELEWLKRYPPWRSQSNSQSPRKKRLHPPLVKIIQNITPAGTTKSCRQLSAYRNKAL
jgi:hypothetical protein